MPGEMILMQPQATELHFTLIIYLERSIVPDKVHATEL